MSQCMQELNLFLPKAHYKIKYQTSGVCICVCMCYGEGVVEGTCRTLGSSQHGSAVVETLHLEIFQDCFILLPAKPFLCN